jgi:hypothetical protein
MVKATVELALLRFSTLPDALEKVRCLNCSQRIEVHQPDAGFPERMLGTCERCRYWYLMDLVPDANEAVMVLLPDGSHFRDIAGA